jgi:hypothetical protein
MGIPVVQGQKQKSNKAAVWPGVLLAPSGTMILPLVTRRLIRYIHIKIPTPSPQAINVLQAMSSERWGFVKLRTLGINIDKTGGILGDPSDLHYELGGVATIAFRKRV